MIGRTQLQGAQGSRAVADLMLHFETGSAVDSGKNRYTVTNTGSVTFGTPAKFGGYAAQFSGSNNLQLPTGALALGSGDFTIECWAYRSSTTGANNGYNIFEFFDSGSNFFGVWSDKSTNGVNFSYTGIVGYAAGTSSTMPINTWTHIAVCRSGTLLSCYVNGVRPKTYSQTGALPTFTTGMCIGGSTLDTTNNRLIGSIDEFRVILGTAKYTGSSFTPPANPFLNDA